MGACQFENRGRGKSAQDVFNKLVENAEREYGDDPYNGTISTVSGFRDITEEYKRSGKEIHRFINDKFEYASKRDCFAICIHPPVANKNKTKSQVEHIVTPGTKKWVLKYVVYNHHGNELSSFDTKGDAVDFARTRTEKTQQTTIVEMRKVLDKVNPRVAKITYKRSTTEKDGEWIFFGYAAE